MILSGPKDDKANIKLAKPQAIKVKTPYHRPIKPRAIQSGRAWNCRLCRLFLAAFSPDSPSLNADARAQLTADFEIGQLKNQNNHEQNQEYFC